MNYIKYIWRIFLRRIPFEKEGNRYMAEVDLIFENIMKGRRVHTPNLYIQPRVNGIWPHKQAEYDPEEHQATISVVPDTTQMIYPLRFVFFSPNIYFEIG